MNLSNPQREALQKARHAPLRRAPRKPPHPNTLASLVKRGFLDRGELRDKHGRAITTWTLTDDGRRALEPREIIRRDKPVWLAQPGDHGDYTSDPTRRKFPDEVIDPESLDSAWRQQAEARRSENQDRKKQARRVTSVLKAA